MENVKAGDQAKITKGPFADFICNVEKIDDCHRAWVLLDILRQKAEPLCHLIISLKQTNPYL